MSAPTWVAATGRAIKIADMDDFHLANAIRLLHRRAAEAQDDILMHPPQFQGEMAQFCAEQDYDAIMELSVSEMAARMLPEYEHLRREYRRRGLPEAAIRPTGQA